LGRVAAPEPHAAEAERHVAATEPLEAIGEIDDEPLFVGRGVHVHESGEVRDPDITRALRHVDREGDGPVEADRGANIAIQRIHVDEEAREPDDPHSALAYDHPVWGDRGCGGPCWRMRAGVDRRYLLARLGVQLDDGTGCGDERPTLLPLWLVTPIQEGNRDPDDGEGRNSADGSQDPRGAPLSSAGRPDRGPLVRRFRCWQRFGQLLPVNRRDRRYLPRPRETFQLADRRIVEREVSAGDQFPSRARHEDHTTLSEGHHAGTNDDGGPLGLTSL